MSTDLAGAQLWAKGAALDDVVHRFTVGEDPELDRRLLPFDALGTAAHARVLGKAGLLSPAAADALVAELATIAARAERGEIGIRPEQEDAHTVIEGLLTERLGDAGQRIHLGRSRNDQVILALRLYMRDALLGIAAQTSALARAFLDFARAHADAELPGYTHLRRAMPSSFGAWAAAFAAGLVEEIEAMQAVYVRLDRCPLGAAAGFGAPLPLDRGHAAALLGFSRVQASPADVMNSRGRHEFALAATLASAGLVLEKFLWDVALYSMPELGFLELPEEFTTGSSIMPQKRNPDVVELARGRCRELRGHAAALQELAGGLPSSYHRDMQLLKRPLFAAVDCASGLIAVLVRLVPALGVSRARAAAACSDELYAAHAAADLARQGMPFREAYRAIARRLADGTYRPGRPPPGGSAGAAATLADAVAADLDRAEQWIGPLRARLDACRANLWREGACDD